MPAGAPAPADLPIEALRLPPDVCASLRLMGFERMGLLIAASRAPLVRRFGVGLATRLDQILGRVFEPIVPVVPEGVIQARLTFVEPLLTAEAFSSVIFRLTALVCTDLEQAGRGARRLDLVFERVDGSVQAIRIGSARPGRDARHLARMLDERLEQVDPGLGVDAMRLVVSAADRVELTQTVASLSDRAASPDMGPLVDRLVNRLGDDRVYRMEPVESDVPERSVRKVLPLSPRRGVNWPADLPRPVRLLDPPQPVDAMALLPDHPPVAFTWRRMRHRVRRADGPERIAGEWWKRDGEMRSVRDYFRVEDEDGRRFWLFRRGNGSDADTGDMRWFLHGFF
jgi:protein ImuB